MNRTYLDWNATAPLRPEAREAMLAATEIVASHPTATIDSRIALDPGPRVRFGKLTISGNQRMDPRRLRKIAGFPEGEPFDPEELDDVRRRLRRTRPAGGRRRAWRQKCVACRRAPSRCVPG